MRVKAVVMTRDDSSGGWLAQDGCLSRVGVCRLLPTELLGRNTFLIHGERLKDKQVGPAAAGGEKDLTLPRTKPPCFQGIFVSAPILLFQPNINHRILLLNA